MPDEKRTDLKEWGEMFRHAVTAIRKKDLDKVYSRGRRPVQFIRYDFPFEQQQRSQAVDLEAIEQAILLGDLGDAACSCKEVGFEEIVAFLVENWHCSNRQDVVSKMLKRWRVVQR